MRLPSEIALCARVLALTRQGTYVMSMVVTVPPVEST